MHKIDKPLVRVGKKEGIKITNIGNKRGSITTDPLEITRLIKEHYEQLYAHKFASQGEMDRFLERQYMPKLNRQFE